MIALTFVAAQLGGVLEVCGQQSPQIDRATVSGGTEEPFTINTYLVAAKPHSVQSTDILPPLTTEHTSNK